METKFRKYALLPWTEFVQRCENRKKENATAHIDNSHNAEKLSNREQPGSVIKASVSDCGSKVYTAEKSRSERDSGDNLLVPPREGVTVQIDPVLGDDNVKIGADSNNAESESPKRSMNHVDNYAVSNLEIGEIPKQVVQQDSGKKKSKSSNSHTAHAGKDTSIIAQSTPSKSSVAKRVQTAKSSVTPRTSEEEQSPREGDRPKKNIDPAPTVTRSGRVVNRPRRDSEIYWLSG